MIANGGLQNTMRPNERPTGFPGRALAGPRSSAKIASGDFVGNKSVTIPAWQATAVAPV